MKFVRLDGKIPRQIAHYALHRNDLSFVLDALHQINEATSETVRRSLWHISIVTFVKCFVGGTARIRLDECRIYNDPKGIEVFNYFKTLRNKHVVHDENSYTQCIPCAALNDGNKSFKIEKIVAASAEGVTLNQANYSNLELLSKQALDWVTAKFDELCEALSAKLELETMQHLRSLPNAMLLLPDVTQITLRR